MILDDYWTNVIWSLIPTIGISAVFWIVIRAIIHADRDERKARARIEKELRAEREQARARLAGGETGSPEASA
ncbi:MULTISPECIES: hypothetical protein [Actinomycetes]|uniref:Lysyl-tRNA synthetase n=1 Tax=Microbacterium profundi TaxID=450380 RepID=A0ABV3LKV1_9MICO|nr:hypothetical protein [Microbacterium profundi]MCE7483752.1 hypothetical protein [Microbacterium profundi]